LQEQRGDGTERLGGTHLEFPKVVSIYLFYIIMHTENEKLSLLLWQNIAVLDAEMVNGSRCFKQITDGLAGFKSIDWL